MKTEKSQTAAPKADEKTAEQNQATNDLNKQSEPKPEPTIDELRVASRAATANYAKVAADEKSTDDDVFAARMADYQASTALKNALAKQEAEKQKADLLARTENAKTIVCEALGVSRETLDSVLNAKPSEDGKPSPIAVAMQTLFGKPIVYAKQGETGKALTARTGNGAPAATSGTSKSDEILAHLQAGKTKTWFLQNGYADANGGLNGTVRTVIPKYGYKHNKDTDAYDKVA